MSLLTGVPGGAAGFTGMKWRSQKKLSYDKECSLTTNLADVSPESKLCGQSKEKETD